MMNSKTGSPFITAVDVVPPSPPRDNFLELDHQSPYDFDPTSPPLEGFPHTPPYNASYNGSYHNSPYSVHSELSFTGEEFFDILDNMPSIAPYEPGDYDGPEQSNALQMYQDYTDPTTDFMSPPFSSGLNDQHRAQGSPFDHSSPASSNGAGGDNDGQQGDNRSRASSVASNRAPSAAPSPQPAFQHSPRMDMAASFNNISIHTPNWGTQPLPTHSPNLHSHSPLPQSKPQSPPRLRIADNILDSQNQLGVPTINAPDGTDDDMMGGGPGGPSLHIVPATPVSGGAAGRANVPFQQTLTTLTQGQF